MTSIQKCIECEKEFSIDKVFYHCECGGLLEIKHKAIELSQAKTMHPSGVWKFKNAIFPIEEKNIVSHPEGNTNLYEHPTIAKFAMHDQLLLKHEGQNPSGSFKDRGMTVAVSAAYSLGYDHLACASTGNTSASLASYAALKGLKATIYIPKGKITESKLKQAKSYGSQIELIDGNFDSAMRVVQKKASQGEIYLVNSLNPFRLEGQKSIIWELFEQMNWNVPDWIVVPGGNLGNTSAFGKAILEAYEWGWISRKPKLATIQASGANPFYTSYTRSFHSIEPIRPETIATAINIGNPVNFTKARKVIDQLEGTVAQVSDQEIIEAKSCIDKAGIGCEPASACALAGVKKLKESQHIKEDDYVVGILTGHILKS